MTGKQVYLLSSFDSRTRNAGDFRELREKKTMYKRPAVLLPLSHMLPSPQPLHNSCLIYLVVNKRTQLITSTERTGIHVDKLYIHTYIHTYIHMYIHIHIYI